MWEEESRDKKAEAVTASTRRPAWCRRRSASWQAVRLAPGGQPGSCEQLLYLNSKVVFHQIHSYITIDKNPRACSGFLDLNFIIDIGFEHQEGDSDMDWSLLARYSVSLQIHRRLTTSVVTLYLTISQIYFYRFLCFPSWLCVLNSISLWVAKYLVGDNMWIHS